MYIYSTVQKPNLINLQVFPLQIEGSRNIIARAAVQYKCIGTILLNDKDGSLVAGLTTSQQPQEIMRNIFEKWIRLDTECSWPKLIECMRQCELVVLAQEIEDALQLHSHHSQGLYIVKGVLAT